MDILHVIILSIVEGITEFLPISSTAHLILTSHILGMKQTDFLGTFEIAIQLGAIAAVVAVYYKKILSDKSLFFKACIGFIPTGILGIVAYPHIKLLLSDPFIPVVTLFVGGILIIGIEHYFKRTAHSTQRTGKDDSNQKSEFRNLEKMTHKDAVLIGLMQSVSMIPGVSRSAASIFGGMALKFDRQSAVDFAFLLAIPTMAAATGYDLLKTADTITSDQYLLLVTGMIVSFLTALVVIKWLIKFVQTNNFIWFGIYRIFASIAYYFFFLR